MARQTAALLLLSLATVGATGRDLLAHKPNGGSNLHAIAVAPYNYYLTTGNGTWSTSLTTNTSLAGNYYSSSPSYNATSINNLGAFSKAVNYIVPFNGAGPYGGIVAVTFPTGKLGVAVSAALNGSTTPTILNTVDQGTTFQVVTGFSTFPASTNLSIGGQGFGGILPPGTPANSVQAPDLLSVACSGSVCWAVGGYLPYSNNASAPAAFGVVLRSSSNAHTSWSYVPLPYPGFNTSQGLPVTVGALFSVSSDSAGKNVFAVGAPASAVQAQMTQYASGLYAPTSTGVGTMTAGSIVYSGNGGMNWVVQQAPAIAGVQYSLFSVTVIKGTVAFAVGGNEFSAINGTTSGLVVATNNGGYSWYQLPIVIPATFTVFNGTGFSTPSASKFTIPLLLGSAYNYVNGTYSAWAVGTSGLILKSNLGTRSTLSSLIYTPKLGPQATFAPVPAAVNPAQVLALNLVGIVWDNAHVGYAFGAGVIQSTHDSGATWQLETPAILSTAGAAGPNGANLVPALYANSVISSIAIVSTTH